MFHSSRVHFNNEEIISLTIEETLISNLRGSGLYKDKLIVKALEISKRIHKSQIRDSGNSYLEEHIYPVTLNLINRHSTHPDLNTLVIVALLHDTVEDGDLPDGYLTKEFNEEIEKMRSEITL